MAATPDCMDAAPMRPAVKPGRGAVQTRQERDAGAVDDDVHDRAFGIPRPVTRGQCPPALRLPTRYGRPARPVGCGFDLPVPDMGVAHGHAHIAVAEQAGDDRLPIITNLAGEYHPM